MPMNLSFWEYESFFNKTDIVIIGSGIVGLSTALSLKSRNPKLRVLVLERGVLPSGASTKNAGFACFGSPSELLADLDKHSEERVFALVEKRWKGLKRLRKNLGDKAIGFEAFGGYEVFTDELHYQGCAEKLAWMNTRLKRITGLDKVYQNADRKIGPLGLGNTRHLIANKAEGQIDTGKMMRSLIDKSLRKGITILNGFNVMGMNDHNSGVTIVSGDGYEFNCSKVVVATNGFTRQLFPALPVEPARAQVLVTSPIKGLRLKGTFHFEEGFYYFRNIGKRVLLGGGRNLDLKGENTFDMSLTDQIQQRLEDMLRTTVVPGKEFRIEHRWSGIMGLGSEKAPIVKAVSPNVFLAVRMGGMGVAIGTLTGEEAAELALNS